MDLIKPDIFDLPPEILSEILGHLPVSSWLPFALTCQHFCNVFLGHRNNMPEDMAWGLIKKAVHRDKPKTVDLFWDRIQWSQEKQDILLREAIYHDHLDVLSYLFDKGCKVTNACIMKPLINRLAILKPELPCQFKRLDLFIYFVKTFGNLGEIEWQRGILQTCVAVNHALALKFCFDTFMTIHPIDDYWSFLFWFLFPYVNVNQPDGSEVATMLVDPFTNVEDIQRLILLGPTASNNNPNIVKALRDRMSEIEKNYCFE